MMQIAVSGLAWETDDERLLAAFARWGPTRAHVVMDRESGRSRGFGFVAFVDQRSAEQAVTAMDGQPLDGRVVRVNLAPLRSETDEAPSGSRWRWPFGRKTHKPADDVGLKVGDTVVLVPSGHVGHVRELGPARALSPNKVPNPDETWMVFGATTLVEAIAVRDTDRWRAPMSTEDAAQVERLLAAAAPIPGWTRQDGVVRGWVNEGASACIDLWVDGGDEGLIGSCRVPLSAWRLTAITTLLDWAIEASGGGEAHGLWAGRLEWQREALLGELAAVLGLTHKALLNRLTLARMGTAPSDRVPLTRATPTFEAPSTLVWSTDGLSTLGEVMCPGNFVLAENGWQHEGLCRVIDSPLQVPARPGRWSVSAFIPDEASRAALVLPGMTSELAEVWQATFGRGWIVLTSPSRVPAAPSPRAEGGADSVFLKRLERQLGEGDPLEDLQLWAPGEDGRMERLEQLGVAEIETGDLAVLAGHALTPGMARALRGAPGFFQPGRGHVSDALPFGAVHVWPWGVLHGGQHPAAIPIFAGGPALGRTLIAFPTPFV